MKRTFILLIISNNLECRIAEIGKFNLSLPLFMTVKFITCLFILCFLYVSSFKISSILNRILYFLMVLDYEPVIFSRSFIFKSKIKKTYSAHLNLVNII